MDKDNVDNTLCGQNYIVNAPQEGSSLCLICHKKGSETNLRQVNELYTSDL